jgi:chemotaxis protein MotA
MIVEGILAIQAGDNPRVVESKLVTFVPPSKRTPEGESAGGAKAAKAAA